MGLINVYDPECRHGHGKMKLAMGRQTSMFALIEVSQTGMVNPGYGMAVRVFHCPVCNYMELQDIPQSEFNQSIGANRGTNSN